MTEAERKLLVATARGVKFLIEQTPYIGLRPAEELGMALADLEDEVKETRRPKKPFDTLEY